MPNYVVRCNIQKSSVSKYTGLWTHPIIQTYANNKEYAKFTIKIIGKIMTYLEEEENFRL